MSNRSDIGRNQWMLKGPLAKKGYDWWWHSFTGKHEKTGEYKAFYVEFFTCNPDLSKDKPVIVWNDPKKQVTGEKPSYLMVNVGCWGEEHLQLHRFYAWKDVDAVEGVPFRILTDDSILSEMHTEGEVSVSLEEAKKHPEWMSDSGSMKWKLDIQKDIAFNVGYGASLPFRLLNAFEMFWHAEGMKTYYQGEVILNGERYIIDPYSCNGYADKNWGGDFTSPWVWLSSNNLYSKRLKRKLYNSVFDIGGGRPKIYNIALERKLLGELYYEGKDYEFNFSKFWTFSRTKFKCYETEDEIRWHVVLDTLFARLDTRVICKKKDMLCINYESPDGYKRHNRLWNGGNGKGILRLYRKNFFGKEFLIDEILAKGVGCEFGEYGG